jgi:DNA primase
MVSGGSFEAKERVKQAVDIVDLVGSHIQLRRQGRNYVGLCPWHDDSRPSLQVNPERQSFKCWVCDIGGDVFSFVMKIEGVEFREALQMLADRAGIVLEKPKPRPRPRPATMGESPSSDELHDAEPSVDFAGVPDKRTLLMAAVWAEKQYQRCLLESEPAEPARRYLNERGISEESIRRFGLGFSPLERDWILQQAAAGAPERRGQRMKTLEAIGILVVPSEGGGPFDRFRGRVMFSIRDGQGRPVGFGGRVLPELGTSNPAKYINTPETPLFTKSKLLYGLDLARDTLRKTRTALVMEGYTDVIVAHQHGFSNAVAVLGTALGESHVRLLKAHADRIVLVLDGDAAGTRRANEVLELFVAQQADLRILTLPDNLDPCDFLQQRGAEAFTELLEHKALDALDHALAAKTRGLDIERDVHGASQALEELVGIVARAPRLRSDTSRDNRFREEKILQRLATRFRVDEGQIRRRLTALRRGHTARPHSALVGQQPQSEKIELDSWQRELLELIVSQPDCIELARRRIAAEQLTEGPARRIYETSLRLADAGASPDFNRLMLQFDEPEVKNLLVELDERGREKGLADADAGALIEELWKSLLRKEAQRQRPAHLTALREGGLDVQRQAAVLEDILRRERARQGISKPTDG